jgi:uncharacterized membrane protein
MKQKITTRQIAMAGLMAALTAVGSGIRVAIPVSIGGNTAFHLGNIICALSGILLGPWMGGLAAGLGSAIYDMLNPMYIAECWLTFLMKGAYGLMAGLVAWSGKKEWGYLKATLASAAGAVTYAILYLAKSFLKAAFVQGTGIAGGWIALIGKIPATVFNAAVAVIFAPILAAAIRAALKKNHLTLE